jgi:lipid II:glycine glycyltransferase (peptidoglycan interpeptide bridge formation enzyme)
MRRGAKTAERAGVTVRRHTDAAAVEQFHRLYALSVRRWSNDTRLPRWLVQARARHAEPLSKYHAVVRCMGDSCGIWIAEHDGTAVAAIIVLSHGSEFAYWRGAMDVALAGPVRANHLLQVAALEHACAGGGQRYAMGLTAPESGLARFKRGFGAQLRVSHEYALYSPWRAREQRAIDLARSRMQRPSDQAAGHAGPPLPARESP